MRKFFVCLIMVVTLGGTALAQENSSVSTLQVTFTSEKPEYILGEPVIVTFEIVNQSEAVIVVDLAWVRWGEIFFSSETQSEKIITKGPYERGRLWTLPDAQLKPKAGFKQPLVLDEWLIFTEPGIYTIKCSLRIKDETLGNMLPIKILPADPVQLLSLADSMLAKLEKTRDLREIIFLSKAMSFFNSPTVIPQLKKAVYLEAVHVANCEVIKAFRRIGGPEAIDALRELSNSSDSRTATVAKGELMLLERGVKGELVIAD